MLETGLLGVRRDESPERQRYKLEKIAERLVELGIVNAGFDFDGTLHDSKTGIEVPFVSLQDLKREGINLILVTGSSPATMAQKLLADGAEAAGVTRWGDCFFWVNCADGTMLMDPEAEICQVKAESVAKEQVIEMEELEIVAEQLPKWLAAHQDIIRYAAFHPSKEAVAEGQVFGYQVWPASLEARLILETEYAGSAGIIADLGEWSEKLKQGAVKITLQFKETVGWRKAIKEVILPGQLSGLVWQEGGDDRLVLTAGEINKMSVMDNVGKSLGEEAYWQRVVFIGNDLNDYAAMRRARVVIIVRSRPQAAEALNQKLGDEGYRGEIWMVEPEEVSELLGMWGEKRRETRQNRGGGID